MKKTVQFLLTVLLFSLPLYAAEQDVWLEAEGFKNLGGWVIDQQAMDQMGSAYIMAHGIGIPVEDAQTICEIPEKHTWIVWVRTRDWTAPWKRGTSAGQFQVVINGQVLSEILGTNGNDWAWQKAGTVDLEKGKTTVALHDLTGFNGRCDAIYLTTDVNFVPENDPTLLAEFRRNKMRLKRINDPVEYDLAIAGGGMAGTCAALAAIRLGLKVVLIQDRSVLGGCNSSEIRVSLGGFAQTEPYPNVGKTVTAIGPIMGSGATYSAEYYEDKRKSMVFQLSPGNRYKLALNERVFAVETDPNDPKRITAYIGRNARTGVETCYRAKYFADCTGDAVIAKMLGAEVMYGRESRAQYNESLAPEKADRQVMGMSVLWYAKKSEQPTSFPDIDWGIEFTEKNVYYVRQGDWEWETGQYRNQADEAEYIRDYGLMTIYGNWSFLKNHSARKSEWANDTLDWVSAIGGKRESYRVVGDLVLTQNDIENHIPYSDGTVSITWNLDHHFPDPENLAKFEEPFRACAYHRGIGKPYPVPYRCLYARDVKNLFIGGRIVSVTHSAFSAVRVMRTLGSLGEVVGMAAAVCVKEKVDPRDVYVTHFDKLKALMEKGVEVRPHHAWMPSDRNESYHFKEIGHVSVDDPKVQNRIKPLNVIHRNMEKKDETLPKP
ncbi:MAG: FAD-dependent oxidoreductase [Planctomycetaceae bacterium]|jgi:hypothetical protein|nr:FAD-dependent oxidoreductase [Planctomycetaceae bacterium]